MIIPSISQRIYGILFSVAVILSLTTPSPTLASLVLTGLNPASATYSGDVEAVSKAVAFSILQPESRTKIPGLWSPFLETGYHVNSVNDRRLYLYTDSAHSPSAFHSVFVTAGVGLPFGLAASVAFSQVLSEHSLNGISVSLTAQVFDFSNLVYTDLVPTLTLDATVAKTVSDPNCSVFSGQANLGAFQRVWGMQFAYIFQVSYTTLGAVTTDNTNLFIRHGAMTAIPLWAGVSLRTQVYFPDLTGTIALGYEF